MGRHEKDGPASVLRTERRKRSEQTLSEFARTVGYSPSYLSAVELGHLPVTPEVMFAYEAALGIEAGTLTPGKASVGRMLGGITTDVESPEKANFTSCTVAGEGKLALYSHRDVLRSMVSLMMEVASSEPVGELFLTTLGPNDDFQAQPQLRRQWDYAVRSALGRGWQINHIFRLGPDQQRSLEVIESLFGVLGATGSYVPWRLEATEGSAASNDLLVASGVAALLRLDTPDPDQDLALLTRDAPEINALAHHCRVLLQDATQFIKRMDRDDILEFERLRLEIANTPGDIFLVREGLNTFLSVPKSYEDYAARRAAGRLGDAQLVELSQLRQQIVTSSRTNLRRYQLRHITTKRSVERLLEREDEGLGGRDAIAKTIADLRDFDGFELALLDDAEIPLLQPAEDQSVVYWLVKGGATTLLETWPIASEGTVMHILMCMNSQAVAAAFTDHFRKIWNRVSPRNRDKSYVTWWLERLCD